MLFKRKRIPFPIPGDARELTEEEMILVNGGSERRENSNEGVAGADVGDTIQRNDGTVVTLSQADIDYAKKQIGGSGDSDSPVSMKNASSLDGNTVANQNVSPSFGVPSCTSGSAKISIQTSDSMLPNSVSVTNQTQGNNRLSKHDSSISMDMVERKRLLDMKEAQPVFDEMHKIDLGAGDMTVTERIELEKKKMLSGKMDETTGKKFEGVGAGYEIELGKKIMGVSVSDKKKFEDDSYKFNPYESSEHGYKCETSSENGIIWKQVGDGAIDMVLGVGSVVAGGATVTGTAGGAAALGYLLASEGVALFCYGMAEFGSAFQGKRIPGSMELTAEQYTFGIAETDFDRWGQ